MEVSKYTLKYWLFISVTVYSMCAWFNGKQRCLQCAVCLFVVHLWNMVCVCAGCTYLRWVSESRIGNGTFGKWYSKCQWSIMGNGLLLWCFMICRWWHFLMCFFLSVFYSVDFVNKVQFCIAHCIFLSPSECWCNLGLP